MRIESAQLYRYSLPLARPVALPARVLCERSGVLIRLRSDHGTVGWGDAAPLPGFSRESADDAESELGVWVRALCSADLRLHGTEIPPEIDPGSYAPSVVFGLETALAGLLGAARPGSRAVSGLPGFDEPVPVNGLLAGGREEVLRDAKTLVERGFRTVKLKLGRSLLAEDVALVRSVRDFCGNRAALRLDANRCWSLEEAIRFGEEIGARGIAYIEEPLADPSGLPAFYRATGIPIGLDETLRELDPEDLQGREDVAAVVLKPTLLGGVRQARVWAERALESNMVPVISSSFESGVGILGLARLASSLRRTGTAAGLDTYRWLGRDVVAPRIRFRDGAVHARPGPGRSYEIDWTLLDEVRDG